MLHEPTRIKERHDLRRIVEQDLGTAPRRTGRAHLWKCPFHNEQRGFSLAVWADGYRCFGACDTSGDAIDWLMDYRRLSFTEALAALDMTATIPPRQPRAAQPVQAQAEPPDWDWQRQAECVVSLAEETLWSAMGQRALNYLLEQRGLTAVTIRRARLGYVPGDAGAWRDIDGLNVPCGIAIPWFASGALWAVKVRRAAGQPKYSQIAGGSGAGLYGADALPDASVALFCEGEFDALIIQQEAGELVVPVTLGSATAALNARWQAELTHCHTILVAYDRDTAGRNGARRLLSLSPRFRQISVPQGNDISDFYTSGGDVRGWVAAHIQSLTSNPERLNDAI